jgi:hypothetical protein
LNQSALPRPGIESRPCLVSWVGQDSFADLTGRISHLESSVFFCSMGPMDLIDGIKLSGFAEPVSLVLEMTKVGDCRET